MDSNMSKQALYEILSACRLCGSNAGYKMPIVQNIIAVDGILLELPQKIKDCVNIEVKLNEKMPPLICEPCVVKVNNFHNFRELCKKTNESTRLKLGLPLQATPEDAVENDGILVEKEQSLRNNSDDEPAGRNKKLKKAKTENKEPEVSVKIEKDAPPQKPKSDLSTSENARPTRRSRAASPRERTPPRMTRQKAMDNDDVALSKLLHKSPPRSTRRHTSDANDEVSLSSLKEQSKKSKPPPKPESKKENSIKKEEPVQSLKRYSRELQQLLASPPVKKRIVTNVETPTITPTQSSRTTNKPMSKPAIDPKSNDKSKSSNVSEKSNSQKRNAPNETKTPKETYPPVKETNRPQRGSNPPVKETTRPQRGLNPPVKETNRPQRGLNQPQKKSNSNVNETNPPTNETDAPGNETETVRICVVCDITFRSPRDRANHMRRHHVTYTQSNKACNACREWFVSSVDAQKHHAQHRDKEIPYRCMLCSTDFTTNDAYEMHITRHECRVSTEVPDVKCGRCWKYFPTVPLLDDHKCWGEGDRPAMCIICKETVSARNLKKHEKVCTPKKGVLDSALVEQDILDRLKPMQVRVARCDPLLKISEQGHFNVATVRNPYGLDRHFFYPYVSATPKIETGPITSFNNMFKVNDDAKTEFDYVHWDSDSNDSRTLSSLKSLCLKVIYSHKLLGKVPKRLRDNESTDDNIDFNINIDSLIDHLNDIDEKLKESKNIKDPESGDKRPYLSPWNNSEDYNSDSIVTDVFRGFDLTKDQSDDSQSLMTDTVTVLLKSNKTEESLLIGESKREFNHSNDDMTKVSQINTEIEQHTTKLEADSSSNNINSLSVNDCISNDFKPYNTETKNTDEIQKLSEVTQGRFVKDLGEGVVNDIEHLEENDKHSAEAQDNRSEDITKVLESNENSPTESNIITLEINKDNNFLYSEKYKEGKSSTSCSDDCNCSEDILKTANEDGRTSKDLIPHCEGIKNVENHDIVHEDLDINEHVDRNDNGHFNQSEVNKSDVNCETKDTSELVSDNIKENDENVSVVKDSANYSTVQSGGEFVSDSIESASSNKDVSDSKDIFKMLNERIALLNQKQVSNSSLEANVSEFSNNDFRTNNSTVSSEVSQSYINKDKVKHVNDKIHHDIDKVHHQNDNVYYNNDNLHHESLVDNVRPINNYNKDNLNEKGKTGDDRVEKEKDLEDLIKLRDAGLDGMDLDNVSDDDFNFD